MHDTTKDVTENNNEKIVPQTHSVETAIGPIIGSLIIVILLIIGALYFWGQKLNDRQERNRQNEELLQNSEERDDIESILRDLDQTTIDDLDNSLRTLQQ